jgi:hypothetical protein
MSLSPPVSPMRRALPRLKTTISPCLSLPLGTTGWSYPKGEGTWKGHFYPTGKIDELEYYSQFFKL